MSEGKHTIVLLQPSPNKLTRTFMDYETVSSAMDGTSTCAVVPIARRDKLANYHAGIIGQFEKRLKELNPNLRNITYDINDLYEFDPSIKAYIPCNKEWIKKRAFAHLKRQAL